MKISIKKITPAIGLVLSLGFVSCQDNSLLTPNVPAVASARTGGNLTLPYRLTKYGDDSLTYLANGQLRQVTYSPKRGATQTHTNYAYSANSIKAVTYNGLSVRRDDTYFVDVNGRCFEAKEIRYVLVNGVYQPVETNFIFAYDAKGQLIGSYDKNNVLRRTDYTFDLTGDLFQIIERFPNSTPIKNTLIYSQPVGSPLLNDQYPLNFYWTGMHDGFLPIFGTPSKHLVRLITQSSFDGSPVLNDRFFSYAFDVQGYVVKKEMYNGVGGPVADTKLYKYN